MPTMMLSKMRTRNVPSPKVGSFIISRTIISLLLCHYPLRVVSSDVRSVQERYRSRDIQKRFLTAGFTGQSPEKEVFDTVLGKGRLGNVKWVSSLFPSPTPQLSSLAVRIMRRRPGKNYHVIRTASDDSCGGPWRPGNEASG